MSVRPIRRVAASAARMLETFCPRAQAAWARAMRCEVDLIEDDRAALLFALGCLWGGCRLRLADSWASLMEGVEQMVAGLRNLGQPRNMGVFCAFAATGLGLFYLLAAGAPARALVVNAVAFLLGVVALRGLAGAASQVSRYTSIAIVALGLSLLATALFGTPADGASRWIWIGPLSVQLSLAVLPLMAIAFARNPDRIGATGIGIAALALALQPDRAMAGVLALGMVALVIARPKPSSVAAAIAAAAGFAFAFARPDALPAVPYVDRILFIAFDVHILAGAAVLVGTVLLLMPAIVGARRGSADRHVHLVFGAMWFGCILAAALGNYPTPVVGYGGSAILGYLLSVAFLPRISAAASQISGADVTEAQDQNPAAQRLGLATG